MMRTKGADGVHGRRIAGEEKRLASAAAEIQLLSRAGAARFRHPIIAAEAFEGSGVMPYPLEISFAYRVESESG